MDDFDVVNAAYFMDLYRTIYPLESAITLVQNQVNLTPGHLLECKFLDLFIYKDIQNKIHITLHDKRLEYSFFVQRFPDSDSAVSRQQSHDSFYGEIV